MKKRINQYKLLLTATLLIFTTSLLFANGEPDVEKRKTYSKSYELGSSDKISINNQFGEVNIVTWDKKEIKVDITIIAKANSDEHAQYILDHINIQDGKNSSGVFFKTDMKNNNWDNKKGEKNKSQGMEINYEVHMPAGNPLNLENQFGKTIVPDLTGQVDITQKFGDLTAGNLSNVKELNVEFGSAEVESINNGKITIKFSKGEIKKMSGTIKGNFEFCDKVKLSLDNSVTELTINNSYSTVEMKVSQNFGGDFDIHTNFGDFHNKTELAIKEQKDDDEHGPKFDKDFSGKTGNGACKVKIKSSFGTVKFI